MGLIIGFVVTLATFPGVVVHEFAHQLFCRWLRIPVFEVCYFRIGRNAGYVKHEKPKSPWANVLIGLGPVLINTCLGLLIAFPAALGIFVFDSGLDAIVDTFLFWLGLSIAMHAFPSWGDAKSIWTSVMAQGSSVWVKLVGVPAVGFILLGAAGSFFWLDALYGLLVVGGIPHWFVHQLAGV